VHPVEAVRTPGLDAPRPPARPRGPALLRAARPRQWAKNVLVLAAPGAAGVLNHPEVAARVGVAFVAFCLAASGGYLLNDARDAPSDRRHPRKRRRPVAAGEVSVRTAVTVGVALLLAGIALGFAVSPKLGLVVVGYVALTALYTLRLRREEVLDLVAVAGLFVIRTVAGAAAAGVPLSRWFLIVASAGALFVVAGKRAGERAELGEVGTPTTRPTLAGYSEEYLRQVRTIACGIALTAYCVWAFHQADLRAQGPWSELSIVPFGIFMLRYGLLVDRGEGGAPEDLVLGDRGLQTIAVCWLLLFGIGVHLGR
jgi:decaprenyl-phosphate phosphoribosyltransferase